jgi:hypothetical protein
MTLQHIAEQYRDRFVRQYGHRLNTEQWSALNALGGCRQGPYGDLLWACRDCPQSVSTLRSCGHRFCNQCQNQSTEHWLQRQRQKQLPVHYYMVTFTLPYELRGLAMAYRKIVYGLLIRCAVATLKTFAKNDPSMGSELGLCAVLHTHTRRLDYHPHVHIVVPGGSLDRVRRQWHKVRGRYLFNGRALAAAFRGAFLNALREQGLGPHITPKRWVAHCERVGRGREALQYLARYLYRGVLSNRNLVEDDGTHVTFRYQNSQDREWQTRTLRGEDFLWLLLQHVLPKGFRRARDYGFLHGNAKSLLNLLQWLLRVPKPPPAKKRSASMACPHCRGRMTVTGMRSVRERPG